MLGSLLVILLKNLLYIGNIFASYTSNNDNDNDFKITTIIFEHLPHARHFIAITFATIMEDRYYYSLSNVGIYIIYVISCNKHITPV